MIIFIQVLLYAKNWLHYTVVKVCNLDKKTHGF